MFRDFTITLETNELSKLVHFRWHTVVEGLLIVKVASSNQIGDAVGMGDADIRNVKKIINFIFRKFIFV
jgi:hypothetical protein